MGNDSIVYLRTDGNSHLATGHLVRCLCIAEALESQNKKVCFLVSDKESQNLLQELSHSLFPETKFSFDIVVLETARFQDLEQELEEITAFFQKNSCSFTQKPWFLLDSYYVTVSYFRALQPLVRIAYLDDLRLFDYEVDLVINYDVIPLSRKEEYKQAYTNAKKTLLGAAYTPLRPQFQNKQPVLRKGLRDILITTGGSDPFYFCENIVTHFLSHNCDANLHLVIGKLFTNKLNLQTLADRHPQIILHENVSDMASLMKQCDFAVSAAGTTLYELCALGIPAVSFTMADNQLMMAETFHETKAVLYAGDIRTQKEDVLKQIYSTYELLENNELQKEDFHHIMLSLVDGKGALKIAKELC